MKYTVIIPAYNEEEGILETINDVKKAVDEDYEIIVVDDGSSDDTYNIAVTSGVRVLKHEINQGKVAALETGVINASGDIIVTIDGDSTYEAARIADLVGLIENNTDLAIGSRFHGKIHGMKLFNRLGNWIFSFLISILTGQQITDAQSGLRAFRKELFFRLAVKARGLDWESEITSRALKEGYIVKEIATKYSERLGESKLHPVKDGYRMLRGIFKGTRPLSGIRRYLVGRIISKHIEPGEKILYIGFDGGFLIKNVIATNEVHYIGHLEEPLYKGIKWIKTPSEKYDTVILASLTEVVDDSGVLINANQSLKTGGKLIIWLPNPNAHALLSWLMILKLLPDFKHIRYYSMNIEKLLEYFNFDMVLYKIINFHINILVIGKKVEDHKGNKNLSEE